MNIDTNKGHPAMDYAEHTRTYRGFIRGAQVTTILLVVILLGMALTLV